MPPLKSDDVLLHWYNNDNGLVYSDYLDIRKMPHVILQCGFFHIFAFWKLWVKWKYDLNVGDSSAVKTFSLAIHIQWLNRVPEATAVLQGCKKFIRDFSTRFLKDMRKFSSFLCIILETLLICNLSHLDYR